MAKSRGRPTRSKRLPSLLRAFARRVWAGLRRTRRFFCHQRTPLEVLIVDGARRRALEQDLRAGLRGIERRLGSPVPAGTTVIVQQVLGSDHALAGCTQIGQHPDGEAYALIRLALQVNGRRLNTDEVLAVLAEQYIALGFERSGYPSVVIPFEFSVEQPGGSSERRTPPRPDPLAPRVHNRAAEPAA